MRPFLDYSQEVKKQIENTPSIIEAVRACFEGNSEPFSQGTTNEIYRLGKIGLDLHLVLRKEKFVSGEAQGLDAYCRNAETLADSRVRGLFTYRPHSPSFCIGVIYQSQEFGVITQDMSEGGKYEMTNDMVDLASKRLLNGEFVDEVSVDLDDFHVDYFRDTENRFHTQYFSPELVLEI